MILDHEYTIAGRTFAGAIAVPERSNGRGVLVLHGGSGLGSHEHERAGRLASLGYVAFAPDLFGEPFTDRAQGMAMIGALAGNSVELRGRVGAAWQRLAEHTGVTTTAVVGHCFGGLAAFELARSGAEIRAAVGIHAALTTREPAKAGVVRARVLACAGADDPYCPREQRAAFEDEMTAAGVDWQLLVLANAKHGFSVPGVSQPGCGYHESSDRRSWKAMLALFDESM